VTIEMIGQQAIDAVTQPIQRSGLN
jgi:hypothetical protein